MRQAFAVLMTATLLSQSVQAVELTLQTNHPYAGMWVTDDGRVRHELLPVGRYVEARGTRERAHEGRYEVTGAHIEYCDDTGFTADGDFVDLDTLHHGGMVLRRRTGPVAKP
ncbi:MAG TPA: Atu4866 domain-containing protein [Kaistia sp.]|nr:Atu4866 domain-containing protein [Kaistia sp.]